jgi:hypothetical protein
VKSNTAKPIRDVYENLKKNVKRNTATPWELAFFVFYQGKILLSQVH